MEFFKKHILGMAIFAIVTGLAATFLYDYLDLKPKRTLLATVVDVDVRPEQPAPGSRGAPSTQESTIRAGDNKSPSVSDIQSAPKTTRNPDLQIIKPPVQRNPAGLAVMNSANEFNRWQACVKRAAASVDQLRVGTAGVDAAIAPCGERPVIEPDSPVGAVPYDLIRSKTWGPKFKGVMGDRYESLVARLVVSSNSSREGQWAVASGIMPHSGGSEEAAFAINLQTGQVFSATLEEGKTISGFGFGTSWNDAPPFLHSWARERARPRKWPD